MPRDERGASILELALIAPVLATIALGVLDLGRGYQLQIRLDGAAREGARYAEVQPNDVDCGLDDDIGDRVASAEDDIVDEDGYTIRVLGEDASGNLTVPVTGCGGDTVEAGERVRVEVEARYDMINPLVGSIVGNTISLTGSNEVKVLG